MKNLTLENIARVCGGTYYGPADKLQEEVMSIITDSRKAEEGCLFVPIVGERVDAHKFIPQVMEAGALATLSERVLDNADFPYIAVESSLQAVKDIAEFYLKQLQIPVVGITGSVGKTSTKEVIASVLNQKIPYSGKHRATLTMNLVCLSQFFVCVMEMKLQFWKWESVISVR